MYIYSLNVINSYSSLGTPTRPDDHKATVVTTGQTNTFCFPHFLLFFAFVKLNAIFNNIVAAVYIYTFQNTE